MTIEGTAKMEAIVADQMNSGRYSSSAAVIEEALHAVQDNERSNTSISESQRAENSRRIKELFDEIDAAGGFDEVFEIERDRRLPEEREPW